jgi:omega-amidase
MRLHACQFDIAWEDKAANYRRVRELVAANPPEPGSLLVLPEMFATGFSMQVETIAEGVGGPTCEFISELAAIHSIYVLGGYTGISPTGMGRNLAFLAGPEGAPLGTYQKLQPFFKGEQDKYHAGEHLGLHHLGDWLLASFICYDLRFPELFRQATHAGAELITVIASWPSARTGHWVTLLQARAIENQAWVIGVNRCGRDPQYQYDGRSLIVDPHGKIVADAGAGEGLISATADLKALRHYRREFPVLKDMRCAIHLPRHGVVP